MGGPLASSPVPAPSLRGGAVSSSTPTGAGMRARARAGGRCASRASTRENIVAPSAAPSGESSLPSRGGGVRMLWYRSRASQFLPRLGSTILGETCRDGRKSGPAASGQLSDPLRSPRSSFSFPAVKGIDQASRAFRASLRRSMNFGSALAPTLQLRLGRSSWRSSVRHQHSQCSAVTILPDTPSRRVKTLL